LAVPLRKVIAQTIVSPFQVQWSLHICTCSRPNPRFLIHKYALSNAFPWCPLLSQKLLCKWGNLFVQRCKQGSYYHQIRKFNRLFCVSVVTRVTKNRIWVLDRGARPKHSPSLPSGQSFNLPKSSEISFTITNNLSETLHHLTHHLVSGTTNNVQIIQIYSCHW